MKLGQIVSHFVRARWIVVALLAVGVLVMYALRDRPLPEPAGETWHGLVYPDREDGTNDVRLGKFSSLEACRSASLRRLRALYPELVDPLERGDYECVSRCRGSDSLLVCEETSR